MFYKWETHDLRKNPQKYIEILSRKSKDKMRIITKGKIKWVENSCWLEVNKSNYVGEWKFFIYNQIHSRVRFWNMNDLLPKYLRKEKIVSCCLSGF